MNLTATIRERAGALTPLLLKIRHHLHRHPELSFQERKTQGYLRDLLEKEGVRIAATPAGTGLLAELGHDEGPVIVLRADMDALPVQEETGLPFASQQEGVMHACGHDVHMTCVVGAALLLKELSSLWQGKVLFLFQPAEEKLPGGARQIIEEKVLDPYRPALIIGQHVDPLLVAGTVGYRPGAYMASSDELYLTLSGRGGHAALPTAVTNTPLAAARTLIALEEFVEKAHPRDLPSLLRFGKVLAPGATNVIPPKVFLEGTFRAFDEEWRSRIHRELPRLATQTAATEGAQAQLEVKKGYPVLINDVEAIRQAIRFSEEYFGKKNVLPLDLRMTSEDFAYYSHHFPALFFRLGIRPPDREESPPLHSPHFIVHEPAITTGTGHLVWLTLSFLKVYGK